MRSEKRTGTSCTRAFCAAKKSLVPYFRIIERNISPAEPWKHPLSLSGGRRAISDCRKAVGDPEGLAELMLFYVECGVNFTLDFGDIDEAFYMSVLRVYADGLKILNRCDARTVSRLLPRFAAVVDATAGIGWGFHDILREDFDLLAPDP